MNADTPSAGWIGPRPSNLEIFAVMFVGVAGIMIAGLQPLLLGTLSHEGKITANQLGQAATAELLTLGLAAFHEIDERAVGGRHDRFRRHGDGVLIDREFKTD